VSERGRSGLRLAIVAAGSAVLVQSVLAIRLADWPIYLAFAGLSLLLMFFSVQVIPGTPMPLPQLATTIGFVYIGGLPIVLLVLPLHSVVTLCVPRLWRVVPSSWRPMIVAPTGVLPERSHYRLEYLTDWAALPLGLWVRWQVATLVAGGTPPVADTGAIALGELAGYALWSGLSRTTAFSFGRLSAPPPLVIDLGLVMMLTLTPFVFLIAYGYRLHGLAGAMGWAVGSLGTHFLLQRLTQRRLTVEEQNRRLEALNRELEHRERLSAIGKMSSVVSHQILQQLGVIGVYADLLRNSGADPAQTRANAGAIQDALAEVNRVLRDLLVFSKDLRLNLYDHPLARIVGDAVTGCRPQADERGVVLRVDGDGDARLVVDKLKMQQAVGNVLSNAIEASPAGGEVVVRATTTDGWAEITIRDHGPGVPVDAGPRLFTPFFTTKEHGTGLGLAIAHEFTTAHGGEIRVGRPPGGGAAFTLRLPQTGPAPA